MAAEIVFRMSERKTDDNYIISVQPSLKGLSSIDGGDRVLLAIAVSCVRTVAEHTGLEAAVDQFNDLVVNQTHMDRRNPGTRT
jgi:hypothetical protein